ncbi:unnamed protein product [Caenorhabditis angaria]|uniref:LTD domain-containing protein n=1 Tax=Caenorhabditis angaria TaxID=860376 RepID=A0A9P1ICF4_9PELO|nr:unnamed protein product [Caenorhabditis angaria]
MASTSGSNSNLEAENRLLKKQLEVADQMYANLLEEFKKLKTHCLLLEEDVELLKRTQNQNEAPNQALSEKREALVEINASRPAKRIEVQALTPVRLDPVAKSEDDYYALYFGKGPIKFGKCDVHGNFLELENHSNQVRNLGFYIIKRIVGETVIETPLPRATKIQANSKLVIFARNSETPFLNSPTILLDNVEHWLSGELMQTCLLDPHGTEIVSIVQGLKVDEQDQV